MKLKKGDEVEVLAGKDLGKRGTIIARVARCRQGDRRPRQHREEAPEADAGDDAGRHHRQGDADPRVERRPRVQLVQGPTRIGYRFDGDGNKSASAASAGTTSDGRDHHAERPRLKVRYETEIQPAAPDGARPRAT